MLTLLRLAHDTCLFRVVNELPFLVKRKAEFRRVATFPTRGYGPRSSVQDSKTGDDTKSSNFSSKDDLVGESISELFFIGSVISASSAQCSWVLYRICSCIIFWGGLVLSV